MEEDQLISMIHFLVKREDERTQENQKLKDMVKELGMYRGVMRPYPHPRSTEAIEGLAAYRGCQAGCDYAEAFEVVLRRA